MLTQKISIFFQREVFPIYFYLMSQIVCRMNCANVLCMKLSKKWFLLHLNRLKLMNYFCHFDVENPVVNKINLWSALYLHLTRELNTIFLSILGRVGMTRLHLISVEYVRGHFWFLIA